MAAIYCQGTIKAAPDDEFDAEKAARTLRDAVKGLGTDERSIITVLSGHDNQQRQAIKLTYHTSFGKDLLEDLLLPQPLFDATCLAYALPREKWTMVTDILATRNNFQLQNIRDSYKDALEGGRELDADIARYASNDDLKHVLTALAQGGRSEDVEVDQERVDNDVQGLFKAGVGKTLGTDEDVFTRVLVTGSASYLPALCTAYQQAHGHSLEQAIDGEMSGATRQAYLAIVRCMRDPVAHFARCFHEAFQGPGTDDERLMQLMVSHSETDLQDIADKYGELYSQSLKDAIKDETSGDYGRLLIRILCQDGEQ